jgi:tRNA(Arg) A34 adenosine deaminase TadA
MNNLTNFIRLVLNQSKLAMEKGEIPVASLIVDPIDERVIARSFNQEIALNDPTAHAEILSIRKACKKLNQKRLDGFTMITYLEPCDMCKEVIKSARISEVKFIFSNQNPSRKTIKKISYEKLEIQEENLVKLFFKKKRIKN